MNSRVDRLQRMGTAPGRLDHLLPPSRIVLLDGALALELNRNGVWIAGPCVVFGFRQWQRDGYPLDVEGRRLIRQLREAYAYHFDVDLLELSDEDLHRLVMQAVATGGEGALRCLGELSARRGSP